jgi:hypothetical protein
MIDCDLAMAKASRQQYYGRSMPWHMTVSYKIGGILKNIAYSLEKGRKHTVRLTMKEMWPVGTRVFTNHGDGTVIENTLLYNTYGMGGYIETDVRYDNAPVDAPNKYPYVGHYNQIFLELAAEKEEKG